MIPSSLIHSLSAELETFRSSDARLVSYDDTMRGNYSNRGAKLAGIWEKLYKHDSTGFAAAMLLDEMIESVINASEVNLNRVLRETGYLRKLGKVIDIKFALKPYVEGPRSAFVERLHESLNKIVPMTQELSTLAVAACMRDAIYAIDGGLQLRWLRCNVDPETDMTDLPDMALAAEIRHFATVSEFVDCLTSELCFGAHLACVDGRFTVIGLKQPGRIAYLSTLLVDRHTGSFKQQTTDQYNAAQFDLTIPAERYPNWKSPRMTTGALVIEGQDHSINNLTHLNLDQLLWLALIVEMTKQTMAATVPNTVVLTETMARALASTNIDNLPALRSNYAIETKSIEELFAGYGLNEWTRNFMRPALVGLTIDHLLPVTDKSVHFNIHTFEHSPVLTEKDRYGFTGNAAEAYSRDHLSLYTVSPSLTGTKEEIEKVRNWILGRNLLAYLIRYTNTKFVRAYVTEGFAWFKKRMVKVARQSLGTSIATARPFGEIPGAMYLYKQSSAHKTYNARCYFDKDLKPTHLVSLVPQNSAELVEMLRLKSEADLPEYLRGWERTKDKEGVGAEHYSLELKWAWNRMSAHGLTLECSLEGIGTNAASEMSGFCRAYVAVHVSNMPPSLIDTQSTQPLQWFEEGRLR